MLFSLVPYHSRTEVGKMGKSPTCVQVLALIALFVVPILFRTCARRGLYMKFRQTR